LLSGFFIALVALALLGSMGERFAFVAAGFAVEVLGLALLTNSYRPTLKEQK
jgi:hypothetical protein